MNKLFITDIRHKLQTQDIFRGKTVRTLIEEIDALTVESELRRVALADMRDEYISVIEICDACIKESLGTEELEQSRGLNPTREAHRHAYEKIKTIFSDRLAALVAKAQP